MKFVVFLFASATGARGGRDSSCVDRDAQEGSEILPSHSLSHNFRTFLLVRSGSIFIPATHTKLWLFCIIDTAVLTPSLVQPKMLASLGRSARLIRANYSRPCARACGVQNASFVWLAGACSCSVYAVFTAMLQLEKSQFCQVLPDKIRLVNTVFTIAKNPILSGYA